MEIAPVIGIWVQQMQHKPCVCMLEGEGGCVRACVDVYAYLADCLDPHTLLHRCFVSAELALQWHACV